MVELRPAAVSLVTILARPAACDALSADTVDAVVGRVAPDEVLLVGSPETVSSVIEAAGTVVGPLDADAVTVEVTDGWAGFELTGDDARGVLTRLSELPLDADGFVQGEVERIPAKVIVAGDRLTVLVPAMYGDTLHGRIVDVCRSAGLPVVGG